MVLQAIDNGLGLVWFAGISFTTVMGLIVYIWSKQIDQQKEHTDVLKEISIDIAVMKNNSITTTSDVKAIRNDMEDVRHEIKVIDKRVSKLEFEK